MSRPPLSNLIILDDQGFYLFMNICYLAASPHLLHCLSIKVDSKFITLFEAFDLQTFSWCPPCHVNQYFFKRLYPPRERGGLKRVEKYVNVIVEKSS